MKVLLELHIRIATILLYFYLEVVCHVTVDTIPLVVTTWHFGILPSHFEIFHR